MKNILKRKTILNVSNGTILKWTTLLSNYELVSNFQKHGAIPNYLGCCAHADCEEVLLAKVVKWSFQLLPVQDFMFVHDSVILSQYATYSEWKKINAIQVISFTIDTVVELPGHHL